MKIKVFIIFLYLFVISDDSRAQYGSLNLNTGSSLYGSYLYHIGTGILTIPNAGITAINISNPDKDLVMVQYMGMFLGAGQTAFGFLNFDRHPVSSSVNVGMGLLSLSSSIYRLATNKQFKSEAFGFQISPDLSKGVGLCLTRRINYF